MKDEAAANVDVYLYRSMIVSLMYLMASRPDIMFAVYACSRFQVTPKLSHLYAITQIFRDSYGKKLIQVLKIHTDDNVADIFIKAFDVNSGLPYNESIHHSLTEEGSGSGLERQETIGGTMAQIMSEGALIQSIDLPLSTCYTVRSGEDKMEHDIELTDPIPQTP
nr:hypothetical protein [Tanacetum cinerariifolium]